MVMVVVIIWCGIYDCQSNQLIDCIILAFTITWISHFCFLDICSATTNNRSTLEKFYKAIQFTALLRSHSCHHCSAALNTSKIAIDILTLQQGCFNLLIRGSVDGHEQKSWSLVCCELSFCPYVSATFWSWGRRLNRVFHQRLRPAKSKCGWSVIIGTGPLLDVGKPRNGS